MSFKDDAMREHIRLLKEVAEKDALISELRDSGQIAREAVERYCPPELLSSAENWLRSKSL